MKDLLYVLLTVDSVSGVQFYDMLIFPNIKPQNIRIPFLQSYVSAKKKSLINLNI